MKKITIIFFLVIAMALAAIPVNAALTSTVQTSVSTIHTSAIGLSTVEDRASFTINKSFGNGSGTTQVADLVYHASRSLTSGQSENLDFYGTLEDAFGNTLNFARIKAITIENTSTSMTITIGSDTTALPIFSPAGGGVTVPPGGAITLIAPLSGWAVTDTSADLLTIANSAGSTTVYKILVLGTSY
ncbi:MAG: hypothetical protein HQM10_26775 [Candidatus Riflebacteria bacterium]|nr:hypothetical protein [Candidatus Riflebacteria bacterium]